MEKKDEIKNLKSSLDKANEKIISLQGDVDAYKLCGEKMGNEIYALKCQIGGFKAANTNYRKQVEKLKQLVEHYKNLGVESDKLYEKKISECDDLTKQLNDANLTIDKLHCQIEGYNNQILEYKDRIAEKDIEINNLNTAIEYKKKPWWRKLF